MKDLLSPKQVAASIGVSESSLKRWCDRGVLLTERTPGGHRRIRLGEAIRFLRSQNHPLIHPEALGLPVGAGSGDHTIKRTLEVLIDALKHGDAEQSRRLVIHQYLAGSSIAQLGDGLLTPALHAIGDGWECGLVEVYQEHRACEILNHMLYDLRSLLPPPPPRAPVALGGAPAGDNYRLPTQMVELVLIDNGWNAVSLGSDLPFDTIASAAALHRPDLLWLSLSHVEDPVALRAEFANLLETTPKSMRVVVGGQRSSELTPVSKDGVRVCQEANLAGLQKRLGSFLPHRDAAHSGR